MPSLIWFREDLRILDNTALYHAARLATDGVVGIYLLSPASWRAHDMAACRVDFLLRNLRELAQSLSQLNIPLLVKSVETFQQAPDYLLHIAQQIKANALFYNIQYEINEARRDLQVETLFTQHSLAVHAYHDQVIFSPGEVVNGQGNFYTIFTPFKKAWLKKISNTRLCILPVPKKQAPNKLRCSAIPKKIPGFITAISPDIWPAGEHHAQQRLKKFIAKEIFSYAKQRDFPALAGTSRLSPYLAAGILSIRQCLDTALKKNAMQFDSGNNGVVAWINEFIWREFYKHILYGFPRVSMGQAFKLKTEAIQWENNSQLFKAWQEGQTGYPIIDAAMRQLKQTGWMHNRLRMLTAMFLVKDLLIDWRWGEKYFMQHLIDGDLASNNGGWQWAASTGTDAVPYFRIFNPFLQSQRFDPDGTFIKQYCPELHILQGKYVHNPDLLTPALRKQLAYPHAIVQHEYARQRVLAIFRKIK